MMFVFTFNLNSVFPKTKLEALTQMQGRIKQPQGNYSTKGPSSPGDRLFLLLGVGMKTG